MLHQNLGLAEEAVEYLQNDQLWNTFKNKMELIKTSGLVNWTI